MLIFKKSKYLLVGYATTRGISLEHWTPIQVGSPLPDLFIDPQKQRGILSWDGQLGRPTKYDFVEVGLL